MDEANSANNNKGARKGGGAPPPNRKNVVEKWCYFPELYKMTNVREDGIENG